MIRRTPSSASDGGNTMFKKTETTSCEYCSNYVYDEDYEYYVCDQDLDEDEMVRFLTGRQNACPYFRSNDEYKIVRKQM